MDGFDFVVPYAVRIAEVNYGGHVANSAVLDFFQEARIAYLDKLGGFSELDLGNGCGVILPEAHVNYLAEMFHGDALEIGVRTSKISRSSFVLKYRIERDGKGTAEGWTSLICFDYQARKPRRLPEDFRKAVEMDSN